MHKYLLPFIFLCLNISGLAAQNIYNDVKDSVVSLEHMFYLDEKDCSNPELIRKLENLSDQKFLNNYMPVMTGSGFIVDSGGYVLTNRHVVLFKNLNEARRNIGADIGKSILGEYGYSFSESEKSLIIIDFVNMFVNGRYRFTGILSDQEYEIEVLEVSPEDSDDLALIRLKGGSGFASIKLADSKSINSSLIGETVYSFGYPLGSLITQIFKDRIVSMNKGNISAFRDDELSIQHNAAISKGNSGGPLLTEDRKVVGINTAEIESGNSLFYSIGIDKAVLFMNDRGYGNILKWNRRDFGTSEVKVNLKTNLLGELESSSDLLIMGEEGAEIYLDGYFIGKAPMYVNLINPLSNIRIAGSRGEFTAKIRKLGSLSGTTELIPDFSKQLVSLSIEDSNGGLAEVFADGRFIGNTPLKTELPGDFYTLTFKSGNLIYSDLDLDLNGVSAKELVISGQPGNRVDITNLEAFTDHSIVDGLDLILGKATTRKSGAFIFRSGNTEITTGISNSVVLGEGHWTLEIQGIPEWEDMEVEFDVQGYTILDLLKFGGKGSLTIRNFQKGMDVYVDGERVENPSETIPGLPLGLRDVYIWKKGKLPYNIDITIRSNDSAFVTYQPEMAHSTKAWLWGSSGLLCTGAGLALGLINTDPYALSHSDNYSGYVDQKEQIARLSGGLIITGAVMMLPAFIEWISHSKVKRQYRAVQRGTR